MKARRGCGKCGIVGPKSTAGADGRLTGVDIAHVMCLYKTAVTVTMAGVAAPNMYNLAGGYATIALRSGGSAPKNGQRFCM